MEYHPIPSPRSGSGPFQFLNSPFGDTTYTKVFVGGLAWETKSDTLRQHFERYGDILEAVVISDKHTGRSKGYGFVSVNSSMGFFSSRLNWWSWTWNPMLKLPKLAIFEEKGLACHDAWNSVPFPFASSHEWFISTQKIQSNAFTMVVMMIHSANHVGLQCVSEVVGFSHLLGWLWFQQMEQ